MRGALTLVILLIACDRTPARTPPRPSSAPPGVLPGDHPAFAPGDFTPIRDPERGDWLAEHDEPGQTFAQFIASDPNVPTAKRRTIYLLPLGELEADTGELLRYARAYYRLPVKRMEPIAVADVGATSRSNPYTGDTQLLTRDILRYLELVVPDDAYALIALTDVDLYPDPTWNFVFGQASLRDRVGVYSFARYDDPDDKLVLRRQLKLLVHELGHNFGLQHCVFFECVLNGSNHLEEADARPLHLCPIELRKLQWSIGFDPAARYRDLLKFYRGAGLDAEAEWVQRRLDTIGR